MKPIENRNVRAVASERYPSNLKCAHPECSEPVTLRPNGTPTVHHIFPRSMIKSDSYFVEIATEVVYVDAATVKWPLDYEVIPHAVGLCGSGTTGHHGDVEEHRAWIKYEDGEFVWYQEITRAEVEAMGEVYEQYGQSHSLWREIGPLNPQPGSREGKPKRKRFKGEAKRQRKTVSIRVPDDADEDGAGLLDENVEILEAKLNPNNPRPKFFTLMDALAYTILNIGPDDLA